MQTEGAQEVLASREASSRQQEAAGNRQYAAAVSVALVAVAGQSELRLQQTQWRQSSDRGFDSTLGNPGEDLGSVNTSSSQMGGGSGNGSTPLTPARDSARAARVHSRAKFAARERLAQLEERQAAALRSPSIPTIERELKEIEGDLQRVVLNAGLPMSPVRQQLVLTESEEHLV